MSHEPIHVRAAEHCLGRLKARADIADVVRDARGMIGERKDVLGSVWEEIQRLLSVEKTQAPSEQIELLVAVYQFIFQLGAAYRWRRGVVDGAQRLSYFLIDIAHDPARALYELGAVDNHLFEADPSVWASIKGDMGIAMLWLNRAREAVALLAVPCALEGVLVAEELAARYRGNLGLALANNGLGKEALICLRRAISSTTDHEVRQKFEADLRRIDEAPE